MVVVAVDLRGLPFSARGMLSGRYIIHSCLRSICEG